MMFVFAITTLGASRCVRKIATGIPDWIASVSSSSSRSSAATIAW